MAAPAVQAPHQAQAPNAAPDRLERLLAQDEVTGIDFVYVHPEQTRLDVFFLRSPSTLTAPLDAGPDGDLAADQVTILRAAPGSGPARVPVAEAEWADHLGRRVLRLTLPFAGGFTDYRLSIDDPRLDPYWKAAAFRFKASCPSELDCGGHGEEEASSPMAGSSPAGEPQIDYRARDFHSFRRALLDFASQHYPDWKDRLPADVGVMLAEIFASLGDEMAYYQDRIAREAYLETATQRRSIRRHARMVDYTVHDGLAASAWLAVTASGEGALPAGADVWAESDDGRRIPYELGRGLGEVLAGVSYAVSPARNLLVPHLWDEDETVLPRGATELYVRGHVKADLPFDDLPGQGEEGRLPGRWVMLAAPAAEPGGSALRDRRCLPVRLIAAEELEDPLLEDPETGHAVTRLTWEEAQALPFEMDLSTAGVLANLVPATAGETFEARFVVGDDPAAPGAAERLGVPWSELGGLLPAVARGSSTYLLTLPGSAEAALAWRGTEPRAAVPEVQVMEEAWDGGAWVPVAEWEWRRSLLGTASSQPFDRHFTLDDGSWERVAAFRRPGAPGADVLGEIVHRDYARGEGVTVRFGDGELGRVPSAGTVFRVTYRLGGGRESNVAAGALTAFDPAAMPQAAAVENPLPASGGADPESADDVRRLAPEAFRHRSLRAVTPEDYARAAEELPWVERAGARMRWTGSWHTAFVTPDPRGSEALSPEERRQLAGQLDRYRQAGREVLAADPVYADLDVEVTLCAEPDSYPSDVREAVTQRLVGRLVGRGGAQGDGESSGAFFAAHRFTFGTPLYRSRLEAAVQSAPGVRGVIGIRVRRRGHFDWRSLSGPYLPVGVQEVIRVENDPGRPDRGSLTLIVEGGA